MQQVSKPEAKRSKPRIQFLGDGHGAALARREIDQARIELHNRLVLPSGVLFARFDRAPLGLSSRKGGKSSAFVLTVGSPSFYYMGLVTLIGLARSRRCR